MESGFDLRMVQKDMKSFEQKFTALENGDAANAAILQASMEDYFLSLAKRCHINFENLMKIAVGRIKEKL